MEDKEIINLFYTRSELAIAELAKKYGKAFSRLANNILNNRQDAEECVNDAYLGAWNSIPPQNPAPLLTYVCRLVRNISIAKYHANTAKKRNSFYDISLDELEECIASASSVENELTAKELSALLNKFLHTLDQKNRVIFVRRYWYGDDISAISDRVQINKNNVSVHLSRTRAKLKKFLCKEGYHI